MIYINNYTALPYNKVYLGDRLIYGGDNNIDDGGTTTPTQYVRFDLNDEWQFATTQTPSEGKVCFESFSNKDVNNSWARMRLYFYGYETYDIRYMSNGESCCDFVMIGKVDVDMTDIYSTTVPSFDSTYWLYSTKSNTNTWFDVTIEFPDTTTEHFIDVAYRKDASVSSYEDRGYIEIVLDGIMAEKWEVSDTEYIVGDDNEYYLIEYRYITYDNTQWFQTNQSRQGQTISTTFVATDVYKCENGTKYGCYEVYFNDHPTITQPGIYNINYDDIIEENSEECQWVTLTSDTDRSIPMQTFRIDATDPNTSGYYFITFSNSPNYIGSNASITTYSICPDEGTIYDNGVKQIVDQTHIEGNIYEYTFSTVVYFAGGETNAPLSQVKYMPIE